MRIWWQSFVDPVQNAPYLERLSAYLGEIADEGTSVDVHGVTPPDRDFGRLTEFRCAILAVDNALESDEQGYDAFVMGHFQDPGLYEARSGRRDSRARVGRAGAPLGLAARPASPSSPSIPSSIAGTASRPTSTGSAAV